MNCKNNANPVNLDLFCLESTDGVLPDVLAREIIEDVEAAPEQFQAIVGDLDDAGGAEEINGK